jgi:hypothetical protein
MFERMIDLQSRVHQFYDEEKWRYIWLLQLHIEDISKQAVTFRKLAGGAACPTQAIDISIPHSIYDIPMPPTLCGGCRLP